MAKKMATSAKTTNLGMTKLPPPRFASFKAGNVGQGMPSMPTNPKQFKAKRMKGC